MEIVLLGLFFVLPCVLAAGWDVKSLTIPNFIVLWLVIGFAVHQVAFGSGWLDAGRHLLVGLCVLGLGLVPFALGQLGGGDVKFVAAAALWFGWPGILMFGLATALAGGMLAALVYVIRRFAGTNGTLAGSLPWIAAEQSQLPYGFAIAAGALFSAARLML